MAIRPAKRVLKLIAGTALVLVGVPLWVSPIPGGALVTPFGLLLLASEFQWAKDLLHRIVEFSERKLGMKLPHFDHVIERRVHVPPKQPLPDTKG